jgi:hypothetical protein
MNVWLVTLGSSDVQLRDAGVWSNWYKEIKRSLHNIDRRRFEPSRSEDDTDDVPYRIAARVLGIAYGAFGDDVYGQLEFPLLGQFQRQFQADGIDLDRIIVLTSDQSSIFNGDDRESYRCPYWQDTCLLYPIVSRYLQSLLPAAEISELVLVPGSLEAGLDDWDAVLKLVRREIGGLEVEPEKVYVSHQAGTPAISSAVQFSSLARFGDRVEFLVSSEYWPDRTRVLEGSEYLGALRLQEAKALLDRYDYSGVEQLLGRYLDPQKPEEKRMKVLLEAAIEWNQAEFHKFKKKLIKGGIISNNEFDWWQMGYESAFLAWVRLQQESSVDAMFHSFRAVEGLAGLWAEKKYQSGNHIRRDPKKGLQLNYSICTQFSGLTYLFGSGKKPRSETGAYGKSLFALLKETYPNWSENRYIKLFCQPLARNYAGKDIFNERNDLFHRLEGLQKDELFDAWDTNETEWIEVVLGCLNFILNEHHSMGFNSLDEASLMARLHQELKDSIAIYEVGG